jgi:hypothetical protein
VEAKIWADEKLLPSLLRSGVFIIVGTWEGCEMFDRLPAYKIANELEKRGIESLVITDECWRKAKDKYGYEYGYEKSSVISVGGPISNSLSSGIAERFGMEKYADTIGIKEIDGQVVGYVWGADARSTLNASMIFVESHLDCFIEEAMKKGYLFRKESSKTVFEKIPAEQPKEMNKEKDSKNIRMITETLGNLAVIYAESGNKLELLNTLQDLTRYTKQNREELSNAIRQLETHIKEKRELPEQFTQGIKNLAHRIRREYEQ